MVKRTESRKRNIKNKYRKNYTKHKRTKNKPHKDKRLKTIKKKKYKGGGTFEGVWKNLWSDYIHDTEGKKKCDEFCNEKDEMKAIGLYLKSLKEMKKKIPDNSRPLHPQIWIAKGINETMKAGSPESIDAVNTPYLPIFTAKDIGRVFDITFLPLLQNKTDPETALTGVTVEKRTYSARKAVSISASAASKLGIGVIAGAVGLTAGVPGIGVAAASAAPSVYGALKSPKINECLCFRGENQPEDIAGKLNDASIFGILKDKGTHLSYVVVNKNCKNVWLTPTNFEKGEILKFAGYVSPDNETYSDFYVVNKNGFLTCLGNKDGNKDEDKATNLCLVVHGGFMKRLLKQLCITINEDMNSNEVFQTKIKKDKPTFDPQNMDCIKVTYQKNTIISITYYNSTSGWAEPNSNKTSRIDLTGSNIVTEIGDAINTAHASVGDDRGLKITFADTPLSLEMERSVVFMRHCPACHNRSLYSSTGGIRRLKKPITHTPLDKMGLSGYISNCMPFTIDPLIRDLSNPSNPSNGQHQSLRNLYFVFNSDPTSYVFICSASARTALTAALVTHSLSIIHIV
jgi:hypothetical protein